MKFDYLKKIVSIALLLTIASASFAKGLFKVGFVYAENVTYYGWTYQHERARKKLNKQLEDTIFTNYIVSSKDSFKSDVEKMAKQNYSLIIVTSNSFGKNIVNVARNNPKVKFLQANQVLSMKNLSGFEARYEEGFYLAGIASAKTTKTKVIGVVGIAPSPLHRRDINAFALGAQSVDKSIKIKVIFTGKRSDDEAEKNAVMKLKEQGADIVMQHTLTPNVLKVAEKENLWVVAWNGKAKRHAPSKYLVSVYNDWSFHYKREINSIVNGSWKSRHVFAGFNQGLINLGRFNPVVSKETQSEIRKLRAKMTSGRFDPFTGPIEFSDGSVFLEDNKVAPYHDIIKMKKFFKGIEDITS